MHESGTRNQLPLNLGEVRFLASAPEVGSAPFISVARTGTATQSSTLSSFSADLALDGNLTNFTHTDVVDSMSTWEVEFPTSKLISLIILHNRDGCCQTRLRDLTVEILGENGETVFASELLNPENELGGPPFITVDLVELTGSPVGGRTLRVSRTPDPDHSGSGASFPSMDASDLAAWDISYGQSGSPLVATSMAVRAPKPTEATAQGQPWLEDELLERVFG